MRGIRILPALVACFVILAGSWYAFSSVGEEPTSKAANATSNDERDVAHQTLVRWRDYLSEHDDSWLKKNGRISKNYDTAWSIIDLDEALRLRDEGAIRASGINIMGHLAAAGRIDDVQRVAKSYTKGNYHLSRFWARLAEHGYAKRNMKTIEIAGQGLEDNATYYDSFPGAPPRPNKELLKSRFFVAAARLELMRDQRDQYNGTQVNKAAADLRRAARAVEPESTMGLMPPAVPTSLERFAVLESWLGSTKLDPKLKPWSTWRPGVRKEKDERLDPIRKLLAGFRIYWMYNPPEFHDIVTTPWIQRQVHLGRYVVALAYLMRGDGSEADQARLFAIVANGVAKKHPDVAKACREVAEELLDSIPPQHEWIAIEANAELAMSYQSSNQPAKSRERLDGSIRDFKRLVIESAKQQAKKAAESKKPLRADKLPSIQYNSMYALTVAASQVGYKRSDLPDELLQYIDKRFGSYRTPLNRTPIKIRGIERIVDLTQISKVKPRVIRSNESVYFELKRSGNYLGAIAEVTQRAKGNSAWKSSYPTVGKESYQKNGLAETLQWTAEIKDPQVRMDVEMGAILEAIGDQQQSLPLYRNASSMDAIAAGIPWPSSGC